MIDVPCRTSQPPHLTSPRLASSFLYVSLYLSLRACTHMCMRARALLCMWVCLRACVSPWPHANICTWQTSMFVPPFIGKCQWTDDAVLGSRALRSTNQSITRRKACTEQDSNR